MTVISKLSDGGNHRLFDVYTMVETLAGVGQCLGDITTVLPSIANAVPQMEQHHGAAGERLLLLLAGLASSEESLDILGDDVDL